MLRRKERNEAHLFMTVDVYTEDDFQSHVNSDLLDFDDVKPKYLLKLFIYRVLNLPDLKD